MSVVQRSHLGFWGFCGCPSPAEPHLLDVWVNSGPLFVRPGWDDPDPDASVDPLDLGPASAKARLDVQQPLESHVDDLVESMIQSWLIVRRPKDDDCAVKLWNQV